MKEKTRLVVGVAGGSGCGKTTFARELVKALPEGISLHVAHDAYYHDLSDIPKAARVEKNFDRPEALDTALLSQHIESLRSGLPIEKPLYCYDTYTRRKETLLLKARPVLIVEGLFTLAESQLCKQLDVRIFIDTPADLRLLRRMERDTKERGRAVTSVAQQYMASVRPAYQEFVAPSIALAEHVVRGDVDFTRAVNLLAREIMEKLRSQTTLREA